MIPTITYIYPSFGEQKFIEEWLLTIWKKIQCERLTQQLKCNLNVWFDTQRPSAVVLTLGIECHDNNTFISFM